MIQISDNLIKNSKRALLAFLLTKANEEYEELYTALYDKAINAFENSIIAIEALTLVSLALDFEPEPIITQKIAGLTLNERIRSRAIKLNSRLQVAIADGLNKGLSYEDIGKTLIPLLQMDARHAQFIAWTEGHRIVEASRNAAYEEALKVTDSFDIYWTSAHDNRTRKEHVTLDGKKRGEDGYFHYGEWKAKYPGGFGVAKMDCRCRCSTYILPKYDI